MQNAAPSACPGLKFNLKLHSWRGGLLAVAAAVSVGSFTPATHAAIVADPASIVCAATYCTDTVNQLEWYKFSNAQTTVGLTYNQVLATLIPSLGEGWGVANLTQVHSLWSQYGYTADTLGVGGNANQGLTAAVGADLGFTMQYSSLAADLVLAFTSEVWFQDATKQNTAELYQDASNNIHDEVNSAYNGWSREEIVSGDGIRPSVGTWLVRALPDANQVPEPATLPLIGLAMAGLLVARSKRLAPPRCSAP